MVKSMTGFGAIQIDNDLHTIQIEIKTLNSKFLDLSTKIPHIFSDKEIELKNMIGKFLERGKVNFFMGFTDKLNTKERLVINRQLVAQYYQDLKETSEFIGAEVNNLFQIALTLPQAYIQAPANEASEETWKLLIAQVQQALLQCDEFRIREGKVLYQVFCDCVQVIETQLAKIEEKDSTRVQQIKDRLLQNMGEFVHNENFDRNRFEQELIYYVEKLDINEEKVRLKSHINYFLETLAEPVSNGKRLGFIAQEIGREINTIGSKANDAQIQQGVVVMKEELEKIKEQLNNVI
jgi:uncharacterized protein (TIGR00255 family)